MLRRSREQLPEGRLVILYRFELDARILRLPLVHEVFLKNPLLQISGLRHNDPLINQVIHGKEQQRDCRETLLPIDNQKLLIVPVRIVNGNQAPEKMTLPTSLDNFDKVIVQMLAVRGLPVIISLVHWNNKSLIRAIHIFDEFAFRPFIYR